MSDNISFNLFGEGGFINPTPWSHSRETPETRVPFYDAGSGTFRQKQTRAFDGGWRWFDTHDGYADALTIYNVNLDRRAYWYLTRTDMVDTVLTPECLLHWVKSMVLVEHNYYTSKNWLEDHIRSLARKAEIAILEEIRGESSNGSHLRSVCK